MKMLALLLTVASLQMTARGYSQGITISVKNSPLEKVFKAVEQQTIYRFVYSGEAMALSKPVTLDVKNESIDNLLKLCFEGQPLSYSMEEKFIIVKIAEEKKKITEPFHDVKGKVVNENGEPVGGISIIIKGTNTGTITNKEGEFILTGIDPIAILIVSGAELETQEIRINNRSFITIQVKGRVGDLDQVVMMAYGQTTKRLNTGSISKVSSEEISKQPVSNPLAALYGRVPGLEIIQSSGVPGSTFKVQIRGQNSLIQGSDPLFIIDGVPFAAGNNVISQVTSAANNPRQISEGGLNPFNSINPADIESIEVLKDADATAIYGSRGANGVILITTKKGRPGRTKANISFYTGLSKVSRTMDLLNTQQYIQMRKEAFANDGAIPTSSNAPDLLVWDTTRYTDFKKLLIGGTARTTDVQISLSGGNTNTQFLIGGGYRQETTVFPGDLSDKRGSVHLHLTQSSSDKKFHTLLLVNYSSDKNQLIRTDLTTFIAYPANFPSLYDSTGKLNWVFYDNAYRNPLADLFRKYTAQSENLISSLQLSYKIFPGLNIRASLGYNTLHNDEISISPKTSIAPQSTTLASSEFGNSFLKSWIIEPQINFIKQFGKGKLDLLAGATFQDISNNSRFISATNYRNDLLLGSLSGAGAISADNNSSHYRYIAVFGRLNYNWNDKYILNLSGRRDGSSRFGQGKQFANFGAAGFAWIISNERFIKKALPFMSFGKVRLSYGSTGNDQIGNYMYLDTWSPTSQTYQNVPGLLPTRLYNSDYAWEINRKFEAALELGFIKDRILISTSWFRNRSGNQLIQYTLPIQTGFNSILQNFPGIVQNTGVEVSISTKNITSKKLEWTSSMNFSIPKNKLVSFPGLATSSYSTRYVVGEPLNLINAYHFLGVDPATGVYKFQDLDTNGVLNSKDKVISGYSGAKFYGGLINTVKFQNFELSFLLEYKKQTGRNYYSTLGVNLPGRPVNQPVLVLDRWQKPGEVTNVQRYVATAGNPAFAANTNLASSDAVYSDASYTRIKNISLSYQLKTSWLKKIHAENCRFSLEGQNLFTITKYTGADPENQNLYRLPPLRTLMGRIQITF